MAVHIEPVAGLELVLAGRSYTGVPSDAPAFMHKLDYDASFICIWMPKERRARIEALHGKATARDVRDALECLATEYGVEQVDWERADGRFRSFRRVGSRHWVSTKKG